MRKKKNLSIGRLTPLQRDETSTLDVDVILSTYAIAIVADIDTPLVENLGGFKNKRWGK